MTAAHDEWAASIYRIGDEVAGMLTLDVVWQCDMPGLIVEALGGDVEAVWLLQSVRRCLVGIQDAPAHAPMECAHCCKPLRGGRFAIGVARPDTSNPAHGLCFAICPRCGPTLEAIQAAAVAALRQLWPDLRRVSITHPQGGRA